MTKREWTLIQREPASAAANMAFDAMLLKRLSCVQQPVLHLYEWESPSVTYGYFIDPEKYLSCASLDSYGLQLARRPTGGGVIFHQCDLTFSVLMPANHSAYTTNTLENYAWINRIVSGAISRFLRQAVSVSLLEESSLSNRPFCMVDPTVFDVMIEGKKVAGGAQRRTKAGYLHQGSIALGIPDPALLKAVLRDSAIGETMIAKTYPLTCEKTSPEQIVQSKQELMLLLIDNFKNT